MNSLVIDTSTTRTSCALFHGSELLFSADRDGATEHAEALPLMVKEALERDAQVDQVVVGMGPGPFTGLRVGITFAQTFATARKIAWIGVCSIDGIDIDADEYIVATDARRKEIYWARYRSGARVAGPRVSKADEVDIDLPRFGFGFGEAIFPSPAKLLALSASQNYRQPIYLRDPDAVPTNERR